MSPVLKFADAARLSEAYHDIEKMEGWRDYTGRLKVMRDELTDELLRGTMDKFGNNRDNEKRAVLTYLDRMLIFPKIIHEQYESIKKKNDEIAMKDRVTNGIHDGDYVTGG